MKSKHAALWLLESIKLIPQAKQYWNNWASLQELIVRKSGCVPTGEVPEDLFLAERGGWGRKPASSFHRDEGFFCLWLLRWVAGKGTSCPKVELLNCDKSSCTGSSSPDMTCIIQAKVWRVKGDNSKKVEISVLRLFSEILLHYNILTILPIGPSVRGIWKERVQKQSVCLGDNRPDTQHEVPSKTRRNRYPLWWVIRVLKGPLELVALVRIARGLGSCSLWKSLLGSWSSEPGAEPDASSWPKEKSGLS